MTLLHRMKTEIRPKLAQELGIKNHLAVPRLFKVTLNVGLGSLRKVSNLTETIAKDLERIAGQKPILRRARKAIAGFKLRQGEPIGLSVTLRGQRMHDFIERLVRITLPRIRDFRGLSLSNFDRKGNYTFGIREHTVFPEIDHESVSQFYGLSVALTTSAHTNAEGETLLRALGLPLAQPQGDK
ncbi:50S ribosomal protein L5 [Candidatus Berkelbacteria bacterium]|nr:50S ribosomal protein L5 [Candidatus Berkelbacteria bacterium]